MRMSLILIYRFRTEPDYVNAVVLGDLEQTDVEIGWKGGKYTE